MALHQRLGELRLEMTPTLREGWLQISQAQFVVGRSGVSSDSYNLNAPAVTKVVARANGSSLDAPERRFWGLDTELFDAKEAAAARKGCGDDKSDGAGSSGSTRRRGASAGSAPAGGSARRPTANPVQWFGGARSPPLELRKAQGCFQRSLCTAIQLANVQTAFFAASDAYDSLQAEKTRRGL